jgi:SAM-dependent methyltransferase
MLSRALRIARKLLAEMERQVERRQWDPREPRPLSSLADPEWLRPLATKGSRGPFHNLPEPARVRAPAFVPVEHLLQGLKLDDLVARDQLPIPATEDREQYSGDRHFEWWLTGLRDYLTLIRTLERLGAPLRPGDGVLELGCSTGRVLRHFVCQSEALEVTGSDLNLRSVEWLRTFMPPRVRAFQNTVLPHLPLDDRSQAVVCAYSVFTHIDELELAWLAEVRRVLRPGGLAFLTIHSEHTWRNMQPDWPIRGALLAMRERITEYAVDETLLAGPLPSPRAVFWWPSRGALDCSVFHSHEYVRSAWGRFFEVVDIQVAGHHYQDVVVLRR